MNPKIRPFAPFLTLTICLFTLTLSTFAQEKISTDSSTISIIKPTSKTEQNFSGDNQYAIVNSQLDLPLRVQVVKNDSLPVGSAFSCLG